MAAFLNSLIAARSRAGRTLQGFIREIAPTVQRARRRIREYQLFAKTKEARDKVLGSVAASISAVNRRLSATLENVPGRAANGIIQAARQRVRRLNGTMTKLLPQIRHWLRTGRVARNKIVSMQVPEVHAIVRGKAGKPVEFGLKWGFTRIGGGFLIARRGRHKTDVEDKRFVVSAVDDLIKLFGKAPRVYAYDRGGYSVDAVEKLRRKGVRHVGLAPVGKLSWSVSERMRKRIVSERVKVEGSIGAVKTARYGFHRPAARSAKMIGVCGHLAVLGFNLNKLAREITA
jgi:hypothetical protein